MGSIVLLDLMGGVALLLWGLHMVLSGVLRAFGPDLRRFLGNALSNRFSAFAAGGCGCCMTWCQRLFVLPHSSIRTMLPSRSPR
jgi:hypothetical protein